MSAPISRRLIWLSEAMLAMLCIAEAAVLWLIFDGIFALPADSPGAVPIWVAIALVWGAAVLPRALEALDVWSPWHETIMVAAVGISILASIKIVSFPESPWSDVHWIRESLQSLILRPSSDNVPVWGVVLVLTYAWWRGHTRAEPTIDTAFQMLRIGVLSALIGAVLMSMVDRDASSDRSAGAVLLFFTSTCAAIGLARLRSLEQQARSSDYARRLLVALSPAALAAIVAILIAAVFTRNTMETIVWAIGPLLFGLGVLFSATVLVVAVIAMIILAPVFWLLDGRRFDIASVQINTSSPFAESSIQDNASRANDVPDAIRYLIAAVLLFLLFSGVTRFVLRRRKRQFAGAEGEERETMRPVLNLRAMWNALLNAVGLDRGASTGDPLAGLRGDPRWASTLAIRERFIDYLHWSQRLGFGRDAHLTPVEHASLASSRVPGAGAQGDIDELTRIYSRARYRPSPATPHEAEAANAAWKRLERSTKSRT